MPEQGKIVLWAWAEGSEGRAVAGPGADQSEKRDAPVLRWLLVCHRSQPGNAAADASCISTECSNRLICSPKLLSNNC